MTFGPRVLKTGIAVTLALYVSALFQFTPGIIAAVAAVFAIQPSIYRSWRYLLEQLQSNTLGAALAMVAGLFFPNEPIAIGIVCIVVIMISLSLKMNDTIGLTLVTVIAVMEASGHWPFALNRFLQILIGIGCASLLNVLFIPPNLNKQFAEQVESVFQKLSLLLRTVISDEMKEAVFRDEKRELEQSLQSLADKYNLFEEERKKLKRKKYSRIRLLVVYKQMLIALTKGAEILDAAVEHYFQADKPVETDRFVDGHLENLIKHHEHALLAFDNKVKPGSVGWDEADAENDAFLKRMTDSYGMRENGNLRLIIVASAVYEYGYHVGRLDKVIDQYQRGSGENE